MSFIEHLFHQNKKTESAVLVDIGADSVAGAYASYAEGELPVVLYTCRLPVEVRENELHPQAVARALQTLADTLIREGAPILVRATGSGHAETILVSIDAPWQKTSLRIEQFEQKTSFVFTKNLVANALKKTSHQASGKMLVDESIIGILLNGYQTHDPYGKKAHRAEVIVLTSFIDEPVTKEVVSILRGAYHTEHILPIAASSLRYQMIRTVFPHERDALIFDAIGAQTSIALVRKGVCVALSELVTTATSSWITQVGSELAEFAKHYPLPRTIFLLAREQNLSSLRKSLDGTSLDALWFSDNPPKIVSVLGSQMTALVRQTDTATPDVSLLLMVLFSQRRLSE